MKCTIRKMMLSVIALCITVATMTGYAYAIDETKVQDNDSIIAYYNELRSQYEQAVSEGDEITQQRIIDEANELLDIYIENNFNDEEDIIGGPVVEPRAYGYSDYFKSSVWEQYKYNGTNKWRLTVQPATSYAWPESGSTEKAWTILYNRHKSSSHWSNTASMKKQFACHANFAGGWKTPWHLEPWRTNVNPITCN